MVTRMTTRAAKANNRIFTFKVIQSNRAGDVRGLPYRVLAIPEKFTLHQFATSILESFSFDCDHAFGFYNNLSSYSHSSEGYELFSDDEMESESEYPGVKKTTVSTVFTAIGKKMLFLFDYGDEWYFRLELIGIEPAGTGELRAVCVKHVGKARPQYEDPKEVK
jgi:hypothetical protein